MIYDYIPLHDYTLIIQISMGSRRRRRRRKNGTYIQRCPQGSLVPLCSVGFMLMLLGLLVIIPMIIEHEKLVELKNEGRFLPAILTVEYDYKVFLS